MLRHCQELCAKNKQERPLNTMLSTKLHKMFHGARPDGRRPHRALHAAAPGRGQRQEREAARGQLSAQDELDMLSPGSDAVAKRPLREWQGWRRRAW